MEIYNIKNLNFKYPDSDKYVLKDINLTIYSGEILLVCGKSGSGKTTLLNHLKTAMTPFGERSGEIFFGSTPLSEVTEREQAVKIGYVLQNPARSQVTDTVQHEMAFGVENIGISECEMKRRISETANFFGIDKWFHRQINTLSGGQRQLLNLAAVMSMQPQVLILDEPTASLDPVAANEFLNALYRINSELGTTIVITEHRTHQVMANRHRVLYMCDSKIKFCQKVSDIRFENSDFSKYLPLSAQIAGLIGCDKLPFTVREGRNWLSEISKNFTVKSLDRTKYIQPQGNAVILKDVSFRYTKNGDDILNDCSFSVPKGCIYAILGGNGSGKSTLLKVIAGMIRPYSGKVKTNSRAIYMPQDVRLMFSEDTVKKELEKFTVNADFQNICELCKINELSDKHPYDISVGQAQRLGLAKLLLTGAEILLLDEITRGTDPYFKEELGNLLAELSKSGKTIIIVSHDIEFCARYANIVGMFFDGEICTQDTPHVFFTDNNFYTTQVSRMSRNILNGCVNEEDIIELCKKNL